MDFSHSQFPDRARHRNRSATGLSHLSLAPLTTKMPLADGADGDDFIDAQPLPYATSYLQGKSAPATPHLSRSTTPAPTRSRSHHRFSTVADGSFVKSISSSHLISHSRWPASGTATLRRRKYDSLALADSNDSDWLLRTGALMSSEAREYKGQAWLVSRQSSTSLTGMRDAEEEAFEQELAREHEIISCLASRRGSFVMADDDTSNCSRFPSRFNSRSQSAAEPHSHAASPLDHVDFADGSSQTQEAAVFVGPDFVNLDEKLEELHLDTAQDEALVRKLLRRRQAGNGSWISNIIGWPLFSVEDGEMTDEDDGVNNGDDGESLTDEGSPRQGRGSWSARHFKGITDGPLERIPPPAKDQGGWKDAAWLLATASKVVF